MMEIFKDLPLPHCQEEIWEGAASSAVIRQGRRVSEDGSSAIGDMLYDSNSEVSFGVVTPDIGSREPSPRRHGTSDSSRGSPSPPVHRRPDTSPYVSARQSSSFANRGGYEDSMGPEQSPRLLGAAAESFQEASPSTSQESDRMEPAEDATDSPRPFTEIPSAVSKDTSPERSMRTSTLRFNSSNGSYGREKVPRTVPPSPEHPSPLFPNLTSASSIAGASPTSAKDVMWLPALRCSSYTASEPEFIHRTSAWAGEPTSPAVSSSSLFSDFSLDPFTRSSSMVTASSSTSFRQPMVLSRSSPMSEDAEEPFCSMKKGRSFHGEGPRDQLQWEARRLVTTPDPSSPFGHPSSSQPDLRPSPADVGVAFRQLFHQSDAGHEPAAASLEDDENVPLYRTVSVVGPSLSVARAGICNAAAATPATSAVSAVLEARSDPDEFLGFTRGDTSGSEAVPIGQPSVVGDESCGSREDGERAHDLLGAPSSSKTESDAPSMIPNRLHLPSSVEGRGELEANPERNAKSEVNIHFLLPECPPAVQMRKKDFLDELLGSPKPKVMIGLLAEESRREERESKMKARGAAQTTNRLANLAGRKANESTGAKRIWTRLRWRAESEPSGKQFEGEEDESAGKSADECPAISDDSALDAGDVIEDSQDDAKCCSGELLVAETGSEGTSEMKAAFFCKVETTDPVLFHAADLPETLTGEARVGSQIRSPHFQPALSSPTPDCMIGSNESSGDRQDETSVVESRAGESVCFEQDGAKAESARECLEAEEALESKRLAAFAERKAVLYELPAQPSRGLFSLRPADKFGSVVRRISLSERFSSSEENVDGPPECDEFDVGEEEGADEESVSVFSDGHDDESVERAASEAAVSEIDVDEAICADAQEGNAHVQVRPLDLDGGEEEGADEEGVSVFSDGCDDKFAERATSEAAVSVVDVDEAICTDAQAGNAPGQVCPLDPSIADHLALSINEDEESTLLLDKPVAEVEGRPPSYGKDTAESCQQVASATCQLGLVIGENEREGVDRAASVPHAQNVTLVRESSAHMNIGGDDEGETLSREEAASVDDTENIGLDISGPDDPKPVLGSIAKDCGEMRVGGQSGACNESSLSSSSGHVRRDSANSLQRTMVVDIPCSNNTMCGSEEGSASQVASPIASKSVAEPLSEPSSKPPSDLSTPSRSLPTAVAQMSSPSLPAEVEPLPPATEPNSVTVVVAQPTAAENSSRSGPLVSGGANALTAPAAFAAVTTAKVVVQPSPLPSPAFPTVAMSPGNVIHATPFVPPRRSGNDAEGLLSGTAGSLHSPSNLSPSDSSKCANGKAPASVQKESSATTSDGSNKAIPEQSFSFSRTISYKPTAMAHASSHQRAPSEERGSAKTASFELGRALQAVVWTPKTSTAVPKQQQQQQQVQQRAKESEVAVPSKKARAEGSALGGLFSTGFRMAAAIVSFGDTSESDDDDSSYESSESGSASDSESVDVAMEAQEVLNDTEDRGRAKQGVKVKSEERSMAVASEIAQEKTLLGAARVARCNRERVLAWLDEEHGRHLREVADACQEQVKAITAIRQTFDEGVEKQLRQSPATPPVSEFDTTGVTTEHVTPEIDAENATVSRSSRNASRKLAARIMELEEEASAHLPALAAAQRELAHEAERVEQARAQATVFEAECRELLDEILLLQWRPVEAQKKARRAVTWGGEGQRGGVGRSSSDRARDDRMAQIELQMGQLGTRIEKQQGLVWELHERVTAVHVAQSHSSELEASLELQLKQGMEQVARQRCQVARLANENAALAKQVESALAAYDEESARAAKTLTLVTNAPCTDTWRRREGDVESGPRSFRKSFSLTSRGRKVSHLEDDHDPESLTRPQRKPSIVPRAVDLAWNLDKVIVGGNGSKKKQNVVRSGLWLYLVLLHLWMVFILRTYMV